MVGIVVVAHSRALARAAVALAEEMLVEQRESVAIVIAAGLDEETFGTDAVRIQEALVEADDGDGVVVLMDLGSAVLSAEMALELLDDDALRERVLLCPAPLVEGLVVAAVTAAGGADRATVAAEAQAALTGKQSQLTAPAGGNELTSPTPGSPSASSPASGNPPGSAPSSHAIAGPTGGARAGSTGTGTGTGTDTDGAETGSASTAVAVFTVTTAHGLHARPIARVVQEVQGLDAEVELRNRTTGSAWVPGASLSRLAALGALRGHEVDVRASGPEGPEAVERLLALAHRNFDEKTDAASLSRDDRTPDGTSTGLRPASPGIGIGPARRAVPAPTEPEHPEPGHHEPQHHQPEHPEPAHPEPKPHHHEPHHPELGTGPVRPPAEEQRRLTAAVSRVRDDLTAVRARIAEQVSQAAAGIFDAHLALLADPDLRAAAQTRIAAGQPADTAWAEAVTTAAAGLEALPDPYLRARAADVHAVGAQVLHQLTHPSTANPDAPAGTSPHNDLSDAGRPDGKHPDGEEPDTPTEENTEQQNANPGRPAPPEVLIAADLTPAEAADLDPHRVAAVVLAFGSPTAHSTILTRALGIPTVVGAGPTVLTIAQGTLLAVDGTAGELVVDPSAAVLADFRDRAASAQARQQAALSRSATPATTRSGVEVRVGANVGSVEDARAAAAFGADLIGLVRTEFLFHDRDHPPDVDEQEAAYRAVAAAFPGRRITFRTLDVGGDKPLRYLPQPPETNPFLGVRGLRLSLRHPEMLTDQLTAIVRVAHDVPVSLLFPMVTTVDELLRARQILTTAITRAGRGEPAGLRVGIMIEVPAAALKTAEFAPQVDFFSLGTNDLTQYALAAERGNPAVAALADPLDPGVLRLIDAACRGAGPGPTVAVCGELAANEQAVGILVSLGVRELSVTPRAVPLIKQAVRALP